MRLLLHFARYGPYHHARLRSVQAELAPLGWEVIGLQTASTDATYDWREDTSAGSAEREEAAILTLFPGRTYEEIPAGECRRTLITALDHLSPDAIAVPGWGTLDARISLGWCRRRGAKAVIMSETREVDGTRRWWREKIKSLIMRDVHGALVGGAAQRDYLVKLGIPAPRIVTGYNVVDNAYFAAEAARWRAVGGDSVGGRPWAVGGSSVGGGQLAVGGEETVGGSSVGGGQLAVGGERSAVGGAETVGGGRSAVGSAETVGGSSVGGERSAVGGEETVGGAGAVVPVLPYFLASNRFIERKNLVRLIEAYAQFCPLPTAHCPLPTAHCPLPTAHRLLPTAHRPLPTAHRPLPTAHRLRPTAHCQPPTAHCQPPTASGPPPTASGPRPTALWPLVLLGDGQMKPWLMTRCRDLGLTVIESAPWEKVCTENTEETTLANCPPLTAHRPPLTAHRPPLTANCPPPTANCPPPTADCPPLTANCPPPAVYFPGFRQIEELPRFYAHAGAFIHPALEEPWGLVINEAMASGLPVLSGNNVGAAAELICEGVNGWTFDATDVNAMAEAMARVAVLSEEERLAMGKAGAALLEERCPTQAFASGLRSLLD